MKRFAVLAMCWLIVSPMLPFMAVHLAIEWTFLDRPWTNWLSSVAERFAARNGVKL